MIPRDSLWDCIGDAVNQVLQLISQADLHTLSLVSKASHAATEPFLYSKIEWTWVEHCTPPIAAFLRTIMYRPELATYVQSVVLLGDDFYLQRLVHRPLTQVMVKLDLHKADQAIDKTRVHFADQWKHDLHCGVMDAFVTLMLSQLHCLTHLVLSPNFTKEAKLLGKLLRSNASEKNTSMFQCLREVVHKSKVDGRQGNMCGKQTADVLPYFYLPDLRFLSVGLDNPVAIKWPTYTPNYSTITSLHLCHIRETQLSHLLSVTRGLKTLKWDWYYNPDFEHTSHTCVLNLNELAAALSPVRATLKELKISAYCSRGRHNIEQPFLDIRGSPDDLLEFCQLEKLEIPLPLLLSFRRDNGIQLRDVVPRNIQTLIVTDDLYIHEIIMPGMDLCYQNEWEDTTLLNAIDLWLRSWRTSHPRLCTISILLKQTEEEWLPDMREKLTQLGNRRGVRAAVSQIA